MPGGIIVERRTLLGFIDFHEAGFDRNSCRFGNPVTGVMADGYGFDVAAAFLFAKAKWRVTYALCFSFSIPSLMLRGGMEVLEPLGYQCAMN